MSKCSGGVGGGSSGGKSRSRGSATKITKSRKLLTKGERLWTLVRVCGLGGIICVMGDWKAKHRIDPNPPLTHARQRRALFVDDDAHEERDVTDWVKPFKAFNRNGCQVTLNFGNVDDTQHTNTPSKT